MNKKGIFLYIKNQRITKAAKNLCGILGLALLSISILQSVLRIFFRIALPWVFELVGLITVYLVFIGACALIIEDSTVRLKYFVDLLPESIRAYIEGLIGILTFILGVAILISSYKYYQLSGLSRLVNLPLSNSVYSVIIFILGVTLILKSLFSFKK